MDKDKILQALRQVRDPQTGRDIIEAGMIQDLEIEGDSINFKLAVPSLQMQGKAELNFACMGAIAEVYPNAHVNVHFMMRTPGSQESTSIVPHIKNIIAVASGKGGVGKSTVAVNLALGLHQLGARVGLMDADVYGPSIPTMLGLVGQRPKVRDVTGTTKMVPLEAYGMPVISIGNIIEPDQAVVLRGPRLAAIIKQFFNDVLWDTLDYLVVDLPPGTGDVQLTLVQTVPVTGVVLVTTPQEVAHADAIKAMNMFLMPQINVPILGVVENMAWFTPAELPENKYFIFGQGAGKKLAKESNSVLLGQIPLVQSIREGGDTGMPAVLQQDSPVSAAFLEVAKNTLRQVAVRNEMMAPTQIVKMG
ncbi:MAG TPA: Mrp/NBP35 family ATP-binding protein [Saprospiraceae bacterium]|nr:Mrp/NBP35 family ATP-binding protein [Saprospiraceae bacterium]